MLFKSDPQRIEGYDPIFLLQLRMRRNYTGLTFQ
jgi:hypothetical protein